MRNLMLVFTLLFGTVSLQAGGPQLEVKGLTFNTQLMLEMYNVSQQNSGQINSYPANLDPGVVTVRVTNLDQIQAVTPCFQVLVREPGSACSGSTVIEGPLLRVKDPIGPGQTVVLNANSFVIEGSYNGTICNAFETEMKSKFDNMDVSKIQDALSQFMKRRFQVCLVEAIGCMPPGTGSTSCTELEIFTSAPGGKATCSVLIYPSNSTVPNAFPNFMWTPAIYPGKTAGDIGYTLEVLEDGSSEAMARVDIPAGQSYYQWSSNDRSLMPGRKYQYRVVSKLAESGQLIGGQSGQGWCTQKWFEVAASKGAGVDEGPCAYTLADLAEFVKSQSTATEVNAALKGFTLTRVVSKQGLNDPAVCRLLKDKKNFLGVVVVKR